MAHVFGQEKAANIDPLLCWKPTELTIRTRDVGRTVLETPDEFLLVHLLQARIYLVCGSTLFVVFFGFRLFFYFLHLHVLTLIVRFGFTSVDVVLGTHFELDECDLFLALGWLRLVHIHLILVLVLLHDLAARSPLLFPFGKLFPAFRAVQRGAFAGLDVDLHSLFRPGVGVTKTQGGAH